MKRRHKIIRMVAAFTLLLLVVAIYAAFNPAFAATCKTVFRASVTWIGRRADAIGKALSQPARYTPSHPTPGTSYDDAPETKPATKEVSFSSAVNRWKKHDPAPESDDGDEAEAGQGAR